mmetsp:Transcript_17302/g.53624  ORF Transcript_17302/g.53624 Transcript_17302/m.53624 type:complete len:206 (+) Transcript_17302:120-737(+)
MRCSEVMASSSPWPSFTSSILRSLQGPASLLANVRISSEPSRLNASASSYDATSSFMPKIVYASQVTKGCGGSDRASSYHENGTSAGMGTPESACLPLPSQTASPASPPASARSAVDGLNAGDSKKRLSTRSVCRDAYSAATYAPTPDPISRSIAGGSAASTSATCASSASSCSVMLIPVSSGHSSSSSRPEPRSTVVSSVAVVL